jgi:ribosomal protein S12 methylthiotransferase
VPVEVAEERRAAIMELQQGISLKKNRALVGRTLDVLIEAVGEAEDDDGNTEPIAVGRARRHAPEVDGMVFVPGALPVGSLVELEVAAAGPYDLWTYAPGAERHAVRPDEARATAGRAARARAKLARRQSVHNRPERRGGKALPMHPGSAAAD